MTKNQPRAAAPSIVLVIDPLEETRQVLSTVFERRGVRIVTARRADEGLRLVREHHPDVIVLDSDAPSAGVDATAAREAIDHDAEAAQTPVVHLVNARRLRADDAPLTIRKPYHYGPLVHTIEELLSRRKAG